MRGVELDGYNRKDVVEHGGQQREGCGEGRWENGSCRCPCCKD